MRQNALLGLVAAASVLADPILVSTQNNSMVEGNVTFEEQSSGGLTWAANLTLLDAGLTTYDDCISADGKSIDLNWHVHVGRPTSDDAVGSECGATAGDPPVGGHYDPNYACGSSSNEQDTCTELNKTSSNGYTYDCNPSTYLSDPSVCEVGDYSGKFGAMKFMYSADNTTATAEASGSDPFGPTLSEITNMSIVFHCASPRLFCATMLASDDGNAAVKGAGLDLVLMMAVTISSLAFLM
ncbi:hypothetical protein SARC_06779 [Sphaeroforma arctica JP610]|uniref:Superoxide dismutase copper/zinc binding domain-containing protein n=1 Tax=Sphaeroforma arctica JP610 TaxID=667725 RepID=A0A0L0FVJ9_9EUKA|nr:hypothetical protein SARC_06779 [Sphaeroforma arctica JP610]KNC80880.1 hypothetical protein SARC_06779 [Sphaeroforma arctica JP610]|eukprot:XP_014154782.1 hypothetical protein SARC_06779 [Sphaeroforma arctica JP610]